MEQWYRRIISGEASGVTPACVRGVLIVAAFFYGVAIFLRNRAYDRGWKKTVRLPVPVISVGNITTGGTGKTPTAIMVVHELLAMGKRPAVLTRGYGAKLDGTSDEVLTIQANCPGVPVIINADRVVGGREAIDVHQADVLVLDDGFQHRRLHRDLNLVLVDATMPMGIPGVLPRGTWREPPASLARADVIMLTRCEQVSEELTDLAAGLLSQWIVPRNILRQETFVLGLFDGLGREVPAAGQHVVAFAGIGNPDGFLNTLRSLNLKLSAAFWFSDHHDYNVAVDFKPLERLTESRAIDAWVTTQKDQVKLLEYASPVPIYHLRIEARVAGSAAQTWRGLLARAVGLSPDDRKTSIVAQDMTG